MQIRIATESDAERISAQLVKSAIAFFALDFTLPGLSLYLDGLDPAVIRDRIVEGTKFHLAEIDGMLAGICALKAGSQLLYLDTHRDYFKLGIAKSLWSCALIGVKRSGNIEVKANASHYAVPAFERLGFLRIAPPQTVNGIVFNPMVYRVYD